jgi:hypothetical protein
MESIRSSLLPAALRTVKILNDGTLLGGDSYVYYTGSYECTGGRWQGKITSQEHTPSTRPMADRVQNIGFIGSYNDDGAKVDAMALGGDHHRTRYDATLRFLAAGKKRSLVGAAVHSCPRYRTLA